MEAPPSELTFPPPLAVLADIDVTEAVDTVGLAFTVTVTAVLISEGQLILFEIHETTN